MRQKPLEWWAKARPEAIGKEVERLVEHHFKALNDGHQDFAWHRMPDARAARGALAAQPADYLLAKGGAAIFMEVKALKHERRLPRARVSQLPTLLKWNQAGVESFVIVFHYTTGVWRCVPTKVLDPSLTSWVLDEWQGYQDVGVLINELFKA